MIAVIREASQISFARCDATDASGDRDDTTV
jgi:hypothetical protein